MKKALILGTNAGQADIIRYLKCNNWEVHACGYKQTGPGSVLAHKFHLVDTYDIEGLTKLAKEINADIVYSVSSDSAVRSATKVAERLGLPVLLNSELIDLFYFKDKLRDYLNENNINTVSYKKVNTPDQAEGWMIFPCVVKPSDSQGQRGVQKIDGINDIFDAVKLAVKNSSSKTAIIEEYLEGVEISSNVIVQYGKIVTNEFTERIVHSDKDYFGLPKGHHIPVRNITKNNLNEAKELVELFIKKLQIQDAVLYIQMKVTEHGVKIIEVAPRLDGCHIWRLIKQAKGYDLREYNIQCLLRNTISKYQLKGKPANYTLKFHQKETATIFRPELFPESETALFNEFRYESGQEVQAINGNLEVVGYYIQEN